MKTQTLAVLTAALLFTSGCATECMTSTDCAASLACAEGMCVKGTPNADGGVTYTVVPVNLGAAGDFVILAKTGIDTVPPSVVTGNIAVSPNTATAITGFSLVAPPTVSTTSPQVTGLVYAADFDAPTPSNLTSAVSAMELAFTDAAGRAPNVTELNAGDIGGLTLTAGVYRWGTGLLVPTSVTLTGSATDVFLFQVAQNLTLSNGVRVNLTGGVLPKNVFWQVAGSVDVGTTAQLSGVVLSKTAIDVRTGATVNGRLFAQTAVNLDAATVTAP